MEARDWKLQNIILMRILFFIAVMSFLQSHQLKGQKLDSADLEQHFLRRLIDYRKFDTLGITRNYILDDTLKYYTFDNHHGRHLIVDFQKDSIVIASMEYTIVIADSTWDLGTNMFTIWNLEIYHPVFPLEYQLAIGQKIDVFNVRFEGLEKTSEQTFQLVNGDITMSITAEDGEVRNIQFSDKSILHPCKYRAPLRSFRGFKDLDEIFFFEK